MAKTTSPTAKPDAESHNEANKVDRLPSSPHHHALVRLSSGVRQVISGLLPFKKKDEKKDEAEGEIDVDLSAFDEPAGVSGVREVPLENWDEKTMPSFVIPEQLVKDRPVNVTVAKPVVNGNKWKWKKTG